MDTFPGELLYKVKELTPDASSGTYLFFDTETTGLPRNWNAPVSDLNNWPRMIQLAWVFYKDGKKANAQNHIIRPNGFIIPEDTAKIHGITTAVAMKKGVSLLMALKEFEHLVSQTDFLVAHNISFDEKIIGAEFLRNGMNNTLVNKKTICTKEVATEFCAIPSIGGRDKYKWPKLSELHKKLFNAEFEDSHNAAADVDATAKCFWELKKRGIV